MWNLTIITNIYNQTHKKQFFTLHCVVRVMARGYYSYLKVKNHITKSSMQVRKRENIVCEKIKNLLYT